MNLTKWPFDIPSQVLNALEERMINCECVDNIRIARSGDSDSIQQYELQRAHGCCGYVDEEIHVDGLLWFYGFNHGH